MINSMQAALIKKDMKTIASNKRLFPVLLIVPLMMTVVVPSVFIFLLAFAPQEEMQDLQQMLALLPAKELTGDMNSLLSGILVNNIMPMFFLMIPIMAASVMAASSFVGEKEKRTLETLLYCPLSLKQIFQAKILASFFLSMIVSLLSFVLMMIAVQVESLLLFGRWIIPGSTWLAVLLLVSPAISLIAIIIIVRGSAKAQSVEESQQRSVFLILPIILLVMGQFTGVMLINVWILLILGVISAVVALLLLKSVIGNWQYETMLK